MVRDLRDPKLLGEAVLRLADSARQHGSAKPLSWLYDVNRPYAPDYVDESTIEKYGDPRLLPSTLPNG